MSKKHLHKSRAHEKEQKEFEEEVLQIDRVTRVVKGGRRLRFRCTVAIGDRRGRVGLGIGKASEVISGIKKAVTKARKNLIKVPITKDDTIPHEVNIKYKAARLLIMPASPGTGVIAGGALRKILHLAGVKNILSKNIGSRNTLITAQASIEALKSLRPARESDAKKFEEPKKQEKKEENEQRDRRGKPQPEKKDEQPKASASAKASSDKKEKNVPSGAVGAKVKVEEDKKHEEPKEEVKNENKPEEKTEKKTEEKADK